MSWQPQEEPLRHLAQYLYDTVFPQSGSSIKNAENMLREAQRSPDYINYLVYFIVTAEQPVGITVPKEKYIHVRSAAIAALRNYVRSSYKSIPDASKSNLRSGLLAALRDSDPQIRRTASSVISEIVKQGGLVAWPELFDNLFANIDNTSGTLSQSVQSGSIGALKIICEDNKRALDREYREFNGTRPLTIVYGKLLELTKHSTPLVRGEALACINIFLPEKSQVVMGLLQQTLERMFSLAMDEDEEVRKQVCRSLLHIAEISPESIIPNIEGLVNFTLTQQKANKDSELALDAAEFWICLGEDERLVEHLRPYLSDIIPVLLECMVYSEDDILQFEDSHEDAEEDDRAEDIKPVFAQTKSGRNVISNGAKTVQETSDDVRDDDMSEGEISDDEDDLDGDGETEWNLRKCSAAALDVFATYFQAPVFMVTLPWLTTHLQHDEWPYREAAVLALGAIADGCMEAVKPDLPQLTPYLLTLLKDKEPVVRQITCWTLGRYSGWAAQQDQSGQKQFFEPIMEGLLHRMLDPRKKVQESAASAFASLEEKAMTNLKPYCSVILSQFVKCFASYKDRNMFILYDCVQTLAEHVGPELKSPDAVNLLMPALIGRYNKVDDQSREMFPLFECLSYIATALQEAFEPFSEPIFGRCVNVIHENLKAGIQAGENPDIYDGPESDFIVTSLDLLSAILQALPSEKSIALVASSQPNIFQLLLYCMVDKNNEIRQSAYALLGDSAVYVFEQLQPFVPDMLDRLIPQLDSSKVQYDGEETSFSVVNNACWSLGEIAMRQKEGIQPYAEVLLNKIGVILFTPTNPASLVENAAIALGRLGIGSSEQLAPHLSTIAPPFLKAMNAVSWTEEKAHALSGFLLVVTRNLQAMESCLLELFIELAKAPPNDSNWGNTEISTARTIISQYRAIMPNFDEYIGQMPAPLQARFKQYYLN